MVIHSRLCVRQKISFEIFLLAAVKINAMSTMKLTLLSAQRFFTAHNGPEIRNTGQNVNAILNLHENLCLGVFEIGYYDFVFSLVKNKMAD